MATLGVSGQRTLHDPTGGPLENIAEQLRALRHELRSELPECVRTMDETSNFLVEREGALVPVPLWERHRRPKQRAHADSRLHPKDAGAAALLGRLGRPATGTAIVYARSMAS